DYGVGIVSMIVQVVLAVIVWRTVFDGRASVGGVDQATAVGYAVLAASFQAIVMPARFASVSQRVLHGQIGVDMTRPLGLVPQQLAHSTGGMVARLPVGIAGVLTGLLLGGLRPPDDAGALLAWVVSMALGVANVLMVNLVVGMTSIWTLDASGA